MVGDLGLCLSSKGRGVLSVSFLFACLFVSLIDCLFGFCIKRYKVVLHLSFHLCPLIGKKRTSFVSSSSTLPSSKCLVILVPKLD